MERGIKTNWKPANNKEIMDTEDKKILEDVMAYAEKDFWMKQRNYIPIFPERETDSWNAG